MFGYFTVFALVSLSLVAAVTAQVGNPLTSIAYNTGLGAWHGFGKNSYNQRFTSILDSTITSASIPSLATSFQQFFPTGDTSSATPYMDSQGWLIFPDRQGNVFAYNFNSANVSKPVWTTNIRTFLTPTTTVPYQYWPDYNSWSRSTPLLVPGFGTRRDLLIMGNSHSGDVFALDKLTGAKVWVTRVDDDAEAALTASLTYVPELDLILGGVSSNEELAFALDTLLFNNPHFTYPFRGSFFGLTPSGVMKWKTYTAPVGYNGNAVWGSSIPCETSYSFSGVAVHCYVTTGNNYQISSGWSTCQANVTATCGSDEETSCYMQGQQRCAALYDNPANLFDAIIKFDAATGTILGSFKTDFYDPSNVFCQVVPNFSLCYAPPTDDYDFGLAPVLMDVFDHDAHGFPVLKKLLGVGQKSGRFYVMDRDSFTVNKVHQIGVGSPNGGDIWGDCSDNQYFYAKVTGAAKKNYTMINGKTTVHGVVSKIDPIQGKIVAQFEHPVVETTNPDLLYFWGPLSIVNDVLTVTSGSGFVFFLRTSDLTEIRRINLGGGSIWGGMSILSNNMCMVTGYTFGQPSSQVISGQSGVVCLSPTSHHW